MSAGSTGHSLPIGLKIGPGAAQDYLVLDFIHGREERECIRDGVDIRMSDDESQVLYPPLTRYMSVVRLLRPSAQVRSTLFAIKSVQVVPLRGDFRAVYLPRGMAFLKLIWRGTRMWRQRSSTFYQDQLFPHQGKQHIVELFDTFVNVPVPTIEVLRHCAVLELLGPSLSEIMSARAPQLLDLRVAKEATRQVLLALDFLHTQCGVLHLGLDTATVLIKFATEQEAFDFYLQRDLNALDLSSIHVKLTGFACAELIDNGPLPEATEWWGPCRKRRPCSYATAPELDPAWYQCNLRYLCQRDPDGISGDVWSLGFFVWELLTGEADIFRTDSPPKEPERWNLMDLDIMVDYGTQRSLSFLKFVTERSYPPPPPGYRVDHPEYVDAPGPEILYNFPDGLRTDQGWSMRERLVTHDVLPDVDVDQVVALLRGCFQADPSRRLTARQLLETEWLREETRP